ncbi:PAS domain S-box protein [Aliihoeflea sp. 40Bstr573]|uniref:PAS domain-containing sensor histidine kinase n=1 Tax=Aliihoeflea sp. 40Bstr573 TaxID=2696467 RepID=UPI0020940B74|nr:PAS domain S-box protein [Aliihoeflea sp. 40Bstr573]MCO6385479.1 PAS domain S-box protein [Aliihoeflea sp. 40Bstr573]
MDDNSPEPLGVGAFDWDLTGLGPRSGWHAPLRAAADIVLAMDGPAILVWGDDDRLVYNDAATPVVDRTLRPMRRGLPLRDLDAELRQPLFTLAAEVRADGKSSKASFQRQVLDLTGSVDRRVDVTASPVGDGVGVLFTLKVETSESGRSPVSSLRLIDQIRQLADGLPQMVAFIDSDLRYTFRNEAHRLWVDLPDEQVIGRRQSEVLGVEAYEALRPYAESALAGQSAHFETLLAHPSGTQRYIEADYVPHRREDGIIAGFFVVARDMTEDRLQEAELVRARERLRLILDSAIEYAIILLDRDGRVTSWNSGAQRLLGYDEQDVIGKDGSIFFTEEDRARGLPQYERALSRETGKASNERWHVRKDGSRFWGSGSILPLADGGHGGFLKILRDRTEEREAQEAMNEARQRAELIAAEQAALLGQLSEGVIVTDPAGRITFINRSAAEIHGVAHLDISPEEYANSFQLFRENGEPYPSHELPLARAVLNGESVIEARWRIRRPDGAEVLAIGSAKPVVGPKGKIIGNVLTIRDDTARQAAEQELREISLRKDLALSAGQMGVWEWNALTDTMIWDDAQFSLFGVSQDGFVPSLAAFRELTIGDDFMAIANAADKDGPGGRLVDVDFRIRRPDTGEIRWMGSRAIAMHDDTGRLMRMVGVNIDLTERKRAEERRGLLINELNHRVKNTLATVQSIASQTFRENDVGREMRALFEARLVALSNAHNVLTRESWEGAPLAEIIGQAILPFVQKQSPRIRAKGPDIRCSTKSALALAMALHELATNAVKYGALSGAVGEVTIDWSVDGAADLFKLVWQERDGPAVIPPSRQGFGSRLVGRSLAGELGGDVRLDFQPAGLICTITAPLDQIGTLV